MFSPKDKQVAGETANGAAADDASTEEKHGRPNPSFDYNKLMLTRDLFLFLITLIGFGFSAYVFFRDDYREAQVKIANEFPIVMYADSHRQYDNAGSFVAFLVTFDIANFGGLKSKLIIDFIRSTIKLKDQSNGNVIFGGEFDAYESATFGVVSLSDTSKFDGNLCIVTLSEPAKKQMEANERRFIYDQFVVNLNDTSGNRQVLSSGDRKVITLRFAPAAQNAAKCLEALKIDPQRTQHRLDLSFNLKATKFLFGLSEPFTVTLTCSLHIDSKSAEHFKTKGWIIQSITKQNGPCKVSPDSAAY